MILFLGHAGIPTGFARVLDSIAPHLPRRVARLPIDASDADIAAIAPELVLVLDEPWRCAQLAPRLCGTYPTIFYAAADGEESVTPEIAAELAKADRVVAFTDFGRAIANAHAVIPHGVDTNAFHPAGTRDDDAFFVLNANRNQPFKRIDLTVEGFALFARGKPENVKLVLHMGTRTPHPGEVPLADRFGIRDRIVFTEKGERHPFVSDERLNAIYNSCHVGINTSEKEGWGLIAFEHGATRAAQIVPNHTACAELWEGAALLLDPATQSTMERYTKAGRTVTVEGIAAALERLYRDRDERGRLADAAFARATDPRYAWSNIAARWDELIREITRT
ncbi:MAG TPA: glycosyltransferase family 4 protein [Thermoanaerobaculia bacterium]|nr:glycosyltransferase family 4 protein [Thermoanaerobaculia bacterium]